MKYRKKPVVIDAWPTREILQKAAHDWKMLPTSIEKEYDKGNVLFLPNAILIQTLEGQHRADIDDMIIQGVAGELYPCKPDIFESTYELA